MRNRFHVVAVLVIAALGATAIFSAHAMADELILCGADEVFIIDIDPTSPPAEAPKKIWTWNVSDSPRIPAAYKNRFRNTDECKPVAGGRQILITSSSGGVALIERKNKKALFWAYVGNAHSAEMLPGGRIAVAGSTHKEGNCIALFDVKTPEKRLFSDELYSGHGVVWDEQRKLLYALGLNELRTYALKDWDTDSPSLERKASFNLPDAPKGSGHDLVALPGSPQLVVTSANHVFVFDRDKRTFSPHPTLHKQPRVKGVAIHAKGKGTPYTQGSAEHWWCDRLRWIGSDVETVLNGERLYKARWIAK